MSAPELRRQGRGRAFAIVVALLLAVAGGYVALASSREGEEDGGSPRGRAPEPLAAPASDGPRVVFQHVKRDADYGHIAVASAGGDRARRITGLVCERIHVSGGNGLCLLSSQGLTGPKFTVRFIDGDLRARHELTLPGILSRARVSPDGRYGATTSFVVGHSYADGGEFSTSTKLLDMRAGTVIADLEKFTVTRRGRPVRAVDRNFWGVTFAGDSDRFYATMRTGGQTYLIEGSVGRREARTLRTNVECPSLSPDGGRVVYKRRVDDGNVIWRLHVLDLKTMADTPLAEDRMVDDQAEWLDDETILYGLEGSVWAVPADGTGSPQRFLGDGLSPAVIPRSPE